MRLTAADQMLAYILSHRDTDAPFDVAMPTLKAPDPAQAHDQAESLAAAGSTWLLEWQTQTDAVSTRIRALVQPDYASGHKLGRARW